MEGKVKNSYEEVFKALSEQKGVEIKPEDLFEVGLDQIIRIDDTTIREGWKNLIENMNSSSNEKVFVRSHGRNGSGSEPLLQLLEAVFGRSFCSDPSNNSKPKSILKNAFKNIVYQDYQISHIFEERTNNPLLFGAPWMVCYTPKIIDPFTGHESQGFPEFREKFVKWAYNKNEEYIKKYNDLIKNDYWPKLKSEFENPHYDYDEKFKTHMIAALAPIVLDYELQSRNDRIKNYKKMFDDIIT